MANRGRVVDLPPVNTNADRSGSERSDTPLMTPATEDGTAREIPREELDVDPWAEMDDENEYDEYRDPMLRGLDKNQLKLLYMVARYSHKARSSGEKEKWLRQVPLLVLIFEGIRAEAFDYDYAPQSVLVGTKRVFMNISQEGKDDLDDLRESGLINAVKLSSKEFQSVTAFQLSDAGYEVLEKIPEELIEEVDDFVMDKASGALLLRAAKC